MDGLNSPGSVGLRATERQMGTPREGWRRESEFSGRRGRWSGGTDTAERIDAHDDGNAEC